MLVEIELICQYRCEFCKTKITSYLTVNIISNQWSYLWKVVIAVAPRCCGIGQRFQVGMVPNLDVICKWLQKVDVVKSTLRTMRHPVSIHFFAIRVAFLAASVFQKYVLEAEYLVHVVWGGFYMQSMSYYTGFRGSVSHWDNFLFMYLILRCSYSSELWVLVFRPDFFLSVSLTPVSCMWLAENKK